MADNTTQCRRRVLRIMLYEYTVPIQASDIMPDWCYGIIIIAQNRHRYRIKFPTKSNSLLSVNAME